MALGDDALAAGMDIVEPEADRREGANEITKTRDYVAQFFNAAKAWVTSGFLAKSEAAAAGVATGGKLVRYKANTRVTVSSPIEAADAANKTYVDSAVGGIDLSSRVAKSGDTMSGQLYLPASFAASSSYTVAYINGDGRVSRGASSERYKKFISDIDPLSLGDLFPSFKRFQMRGGDGVWRYGYTAEQLAADPTTEPFVIYRRHVEDDGTAPHLERDEHGNPIPESIDFIGFLLAQNAQLHARLAALEDRS